jgi:replicative DNA helicase
MKIPPHDITIEKAILGAIMLEKNAIYEAVQVLKPGIFYSENHNIIYDFILKLYKESQPIDILSVVNQLRQAGKLEEIGGAYYISILTSEIGSACNIENHCKIIYELYLKRQVLITLQNHISEIDNNREIDIHSAYNNISAELSGLFELSLSSDYCNILELLNERLDEISKLKPDENKLIGIHTGFQILDNFTNGFQPADYVIIAGRPSMGKTVVSLICALACIFISKKKVLYFSLEMSKKRIADRIISLICKIDSRRISSNRLSEFEWKLIDDKLETFINKYLFIIDSPGLTIEQIRAKAIVMHRKYGIDEIIIDYIQLIRHSKPKENTNYNVTHISNNIKSISKEISCPVIALSQLNRAGSDVPVLKDLRDSGSLEQDADIVWFLHRLDYENKECEPEAKNRIINLISKNRNSIVSAFYSYRNFDWSYIGQICEDELESIEQSIPF